mmetsp:Transcript_9140/g.18240  ORF Transcript_9140/g.18240 Transcript_9140/m.18240 type:complete len:558 (+) Transcript_9140:244-1917(+)
MNLPESKTMTSMFEGDDPLPPGTTSVAKVTCMDVVMGRGSGTQNHCGNVTYRKLVFLNKELYATSSKFDKIKISKAIVRAIREKGGHFLEMEDQLYFDIGDKRAWDKTSQALREGQTEIRKCLEQEEARWKETKPKTQYDVASKVAQYKQIISDHRFLDFSKRVLESLYNPRSSAAANLPTTESTPGIHVPEAVQHACKPNCPHARRRETLNKANADLFAIHQSKSGRKASSVPPSSTTSQQNYMTYPQQHQQYQTHDIQPVYFSQPYVPEIMPIQNNQNYLQVGYSASRGIDSLPVHGPDWQPAERPDMGNFNIKNDYQHSNANSRKSKVGVNDDSEASDPHENFDSLEPLPYNVENLHVNLPGSRYTVASGTSLRDILAAIDLDLNPDEGRSSMDSLLSKEIDSLIHAQSDALQYIDAFKAFEDLVLDEDNFVHESSNHCSTGGGISDLMNRDDVSLMNMSFLTLDDKTKDGYDKFEGMKGASGDESPREMGPPNEINKDSNYPQISCSNMSVMSMDDMGSSRSSNDTDSNSNEETPPEVTEMHAEKRRNGHSRN